MLLLFQPGPAEEPLILMLALPSVLCLAVTMNTFYQMEPDRYVSQKLYRDVVGEHNEQAVKEALKNAKNTKTPVKEVVKEPVKPQLIIYYTADSYSIKDKDMILLKALAKEMKKNPDSKYEICGYTDSKTGTPEYNSALREKRANNVINTLIRLGVDKDQLVKKTSDQTLNQFGAYALDRAVTITKI